MRVAVIGAGIAGLAAARDLARDHDVTVFESNAAPGGHTYTVDVPNGDDVCPVDMGFIVFNELNYPGFSGMLDDLGVPSQPTDMSFSVSDPGVGVEYNATRIATLFAQRRNLVRPGFWRMLRDLARFYRTAPELLERDDPDLTLDEYLAAGEYSREFAHWHLLPMAQALWSSSDADIRRFPATALVRFMANHRMLQVADRPGWRVVRGGSRSYVHAWQRGFERAGGRLHTGAQVKNILRDPRGVRVVLSDARPLFDRVVLACHSDQALALLRDPTPPEREVLGAIRFQRNAVDLHTDRRLLPQRRACWAAWNVIGRRPGQGKDESNEKGSAGGAVSVTYNMNILQGLHTAEPLCVTLNRRADIAPGRLLHSTHMAHPVFEPAMLRAQRRWHEIDGTGGVHYCGAYWGYGFHEDGFRSGLRAAAALRERLQAAA